VTQNIIYVNLPAGQAPPPQAPPVESSPREVHYHTTNLYQSPRRRRSGLGTSFLATLGFVLGGVAAGAACVPQIVWLAKPIAMLGFAMATLGMLGALLFGRVGKLMPLIALLACASAYGLWEKNTGQPIALPKIDLNLLPTSPTTPTAPTPVNPAPPAHSSSAAPNDPTRLHDNTIFGDGMGGWSKPSDTATPAVPANPAPAPALVAPSAVINLATAKANLEKARDAAAARLNIDYKSARSAAADAASQYEQAKINDSPGSPDLIAASQQRLQADSNMNQIEAKLRSDPAVAAAEKALNAAAASPK
jgi:hypothetical protein